MNDFRDQWEKEKIGEKPTVEITSTFQTLLTEIELLNSRVTLLERVRISSSKRDSIPF